MNEQLPRRTRLRLVGVLLLLLFVGFVVDVASGTSFLDALGLDATLAALVGCALVGIVIGRRIGRSRQTSDEETLDEDSRKH